MAKVGAGEVSELSPDIALLAMAFSAIALCIVGNASAHGGRLNAEGYHHDRKHGGYHCHRGGGALGDLIPANGFAPGRSVVFANYAEARAAPVRRGESGGCDRLDRDRDGGGRPSGGDA